MGARLPSMSHLTPQAHPLPPPPMLTTCFDMSRRVKHPLGPPQSLPDTNRMVQQGCKQPPSSLSAPPPSSLHIMRTDVYLRFGNLPEPSQLPTDATRAAEQGYKPPHSPPTLSPLCITRMDMSHTTPGLLGQISMHSMCSTPL